MSTEHSEPQSSPEPESIPFWKKALLGLAVLALIAGFALKATADENPVAQNGMSGVQSVGGGNSLTGGDPIPGIGAGETIEDDSMSSYSPFFVKGGFSFLIAFCVGWALRVFFKISALVVGVVALALFGLQKAGFVDPNWDAMSGWWDSISGKVMQSTKGMKGFLTGNLPSAGLAGLGLFTGFKRG